MTKLTRNLFCGVLAAALLAACGENQTPAPAPAVAPTPAPAPTPEPAPATEPGDDPYPPLAGLRVAPGKVEIRLAQLELTLEGTENDVPGDMICFSPGGDSVEIHTSKWQRRAAAGAAWADIPDTDQRGGLCAYKTTEAGAYRLVVDITLDGSRRTYASENSFTVSG